MNMIYDLFYFICKNILINIFFVCINCKKEEDEQYKFVKNKVKIC